MRTRCVSADTHHGMLLPPERAEAEGRIRIEALDLMMGVGYLQRGAGDLGRAGQRHLPRLAACDGGRPAMSGQSTRGGCGDLG